jgi:hypothetical protein
MTAPLTGGCLCGAVRYTCGAEPVVSGHCHCRDCQRATGAAFLSGLAVPQDALEVTGAVTYFDTENESGNTSSRGFCPECGARILGRSTGMPGLVMVHATSLDDPSRFQPTMHIFMASAQPWDTPVDDLPKFARMPDLAVS